MRVLGIETSCDETGVAVFDDGHGLMANQVYAQTGIHAEYGGVVPELASRDHIRKLTPMIGRVLKESGLNGSELDGIAYTEGPGLVGALMVGAAVAKGLGLAWRIPVIGIHHMEGHLLSPMLGDPAPVAPFVALLVSGGHTMLVEVTAVGSYRLLGETLDDAAGEAFDKTARLLGLPYPGGPAVAELAAKGRPGKFSLPRPLLNKPGCDFSFSGLKTAVLYALRGADLDDQGRADIALEFQTAVVDTLTAKCVRALEKTGASRLVVAGGVSANTSLRNRLKSAAGDMGAEVFFPRPEFCTDNGAMIAYAGCLRLNSGDVEDRGISVRARWSLCDL